MDYVGEHLLPGKLGQFFVVLSFAASFVATLSYFKSANAKSLEDQGVWKRMARFAFCINAISIFIIFATIYYIVRKHYFEYNFAWEHSGRKMEPKYMLACIWEAQEGSFLLWMIWHGILGFILMFKARQWEAPVLTVISFAQFCLATMILGVYVFGHQIGHSPFMLVRQMFQEAPIFQRADYLSIPQMQDGQNLNALLQNYWMVIHPPILFLGFASTIVPFSFAIAGLWKKQYGSWTRTALPWTLFSSAMLITGVMMGAAWAYESLTFGGYWAWDPVENASLVPWLVLVAGLHTQVVYNATGHSLRATYVFLILEFILVLYSTFLTRSGILGDTSVHAFVGSGMDLQLILFILVFLIPAGILYGLNYNKIPHIKKEENTWSREFWMFIGSLIIFLSAIFISVATSLPVINHIFGTNWSTGDDPKFAYNRILIFIAIILGVLTAGGQYLRYKNTPRHVLWNKIWPVTAVALLFSILISVFGGIHYDQYGTGFLSAIHLALFAAIYSLVANAGYIFTGLKGKLRVAGASVAHVGFGLLLAGILISSSKKKVLSYNTTGINLPFDPKTKENPLENITLLKDVKTDMGTYYATYLSNDSVNKTGNIIYFQVNFQDKKTGESFDLWPNLIKNTKGVESYSNNPDKRHYLGHDIFTYISYANILDKVKDTTGFVSHPVALHDTIFYSRGIMILDTVYVNPDNAKYHFTPSDTALLAHIRVISRDSSQYTISPLLYVKDNRIHRVADTLFAQNLAVEIGSVMTNRKIDLRVKESSDMVPFVSLKVYTFPQINMVWIGILVMVTGFWMSIFYRRKQRLRPEPPTVA
ncbi:MAG: cytochrome c biogenesis protein CcsA [Bacteroidota bacterium]|nr:cytochrome c biogenesis protein CcsA [Bacteroidota bacterium]